MFPNNKFLEIYINSNNKEKYLYSYAIYYTKKKTKRKTP